MSQTPRPPRIGYRSLQKRIDAWIRVRLWLQVVIGLVAGIGVGVLLGPDLAIVPRGISEALGTWLALPGRLFLSLIGMVLVPLVISSIILGLGGSASGDELRAVGGRLTLYIVATTTLAAGLGLALASAVRPGERIHLDAPATPLPKPTLAAEAETAAGALRSIESLSGEVTRRIVEFIPQNIVAAIVDQQMLAIVMFAIFVGIAFATSQRRDTLAPLARLFEALLEISMTVVKWAMWLMPLAVFGLMAELVARVGLSTLAGMWAYVATVLVGLGLLLVLFALLAGLFGAIGPWRFVRAIAPVQLLAFSTSSSAAVMPLSIKTAVEALDVPPKLASLVVPLGATVNMAGTALYQAVAVGFLAQMSRVELSSGDLALIVATLVASSIGAPGTPGVGIVLLASIVGDFGIPTTGIILILGVDRLLDMCRTVVNVTGDLAACRILRSVLGAAGQRDAGTARA
ncbi:MAG: dicarboxylate/amino acid:cation symporter [Alphaproteobacteria bacterium]|nr:dicarboxylate/amino acid:cation symporter [Alphaproteobacteria bacterium]